MAGGHAGDIEAFLPLLVDPLEGEAVRHLGQTWEIADSISDAPSTHTAYKMISKVLRTLLPLITPAWVVCASVAMQRAS